MNNDIDTPLNFTFGVAEQAYCIDLLDQFPKKNKNRFSKHSPDNREKMRLFNKAAWLYMRNFLIKHHHSDGDLSPPTAYEMASLLCALADIFNNKVNRHIEEGLANIGCSVYDFDEYIGIKSIEDMEFLDKSMEYVFTPPCEEEDIPSLEELLDIEDYRLEMLAGIRGLCEFCFGIGSSGVLLPYSDSVEERNLDLSSPEEFLNVLETKFTSEEMNIKFSGLEGEDNVYLVVNRTVRKSDDRGGIMISYWASPSKITDDCGDDITEEYFGEEVPVFKTVHIKSKRNPNGKINFKKIDRLAIDDLICNQATMVL
jgi:hypothetical protein